MKEERTILLDFWNTIAESKERDRFWRMILKSFDDSNANKQDFFRYWKENWFKSNIGKKNFIQGLKEKFKIRNEEIIYLKGILDYRNLTLINGRLDSLLKLRDANYEIHLVSDCGYDVKEFVKKSILDQLLLKRFYSFEHETTKDEDLYGLVSKEVGINCLMIGDDPKRDYEIPKNYGFRTILIKKTDSLENLIWNN